MTIKELSSDTQATIRCALSFISTTRQLDGEFETRVGVDRSEFADLLMRWPAVDDHDDNGPAAIAINNALNEVLSGIDLSSEDWRQLGASRSDIAAAYTEWASGRGRS